jgi:hypothetical protein
VGTPLTARLAACNTGSESISRTPEMSLQTRRRLHAASLVGDEVSIAGDTDGSTPLATTEYLVVDSEGDSEPGETVRDPSLRVARQGMAGVSLAALDDDHLDLLGGEGLDAHQDLVAPDSLEQYDPTRSPPRQFQLLPASTGLRAEAAATLVGNQGWVFLAGSRKAWNRCPTRSFRRIVGPFADRPGRSSAARQGQTQRREGT